MASVQDLKSVIYVDKVYAGIAECRRRIREPKQEIVDLAFSEFRIFSQNGEDGILIDILRHLDIKSPYFVEFGVGDGWSCNTRVLAEIFGWPGLILESDAKEFALSQMRYVNSSRVQVRQEHVAPDNINRIFDESKVPPFFGVLSIDIDGQDYWVWQAIEARFSPDVVIIEVNTSFGVERALTERQGNAILALTETFGASIAALRALGESKGYRLVHVDMAGVNAFFVHERHLSRVTFRGLTDRSPNYGLRGRFHDRDRLYGAYTGPARASVVVETD